MSELKFNASRAVGADFSFFDPRNWAMTKEEPCITGKPDSYSFRTMAGIITVKGDFFMKVEYGEDGEIVCGKDMIGLVDAIAFLTFRLLDLGLDATAVSNACGAAGERPNASGAVRLGKFVQRQLERAILSGEDDWTPVDALTRKSGVTIEAGKGDDVIAGSARRPDPRRRRPGPAPGRIGR